MMSPHNRGAITNNNKQEIHKPRDLFDVSGDGEEQIKKNDSFLRESDMRNINKMIDKLSIKEITDLISQNNKVSKKIIYNYCLKLKNEK